MPTNLIRIEWMFYGKIVILIKSAYCTGQHMPKKKMPQRAREYTEELAFLYREEQKYLAEGDENNLRIVHRLQQRLRGDEIEINKQDTIAYMERVSGEPDYPHSLKTALSDYLYLLDDE